MKQRQTAVVVREWNDGRIVFWGGDHWHEYEDAALYSFRGAIAVAKRLNRDIPDVKAEAWGNYATPAQCRLYPEETS